MENIVIFNPSSFIYGSARGLLNLVKVLSQFYKVTVILPKKGPLEEEIINISKKVEIKKIPLPVLRLSTSFIYYFYFVLVSLFDFIYLSFYLRKNKVKLLISNNSLLLLPVLLSCIFKIKHIWFIREFFQYKPLHKLINLLVKTKFSYPVFQSQTIANKFSLIDGPVIYEPLSINVADKNNKKNLLPPVMKKPEAVIISMVSRIHPAKGQLVFLRRFLQVLKKDRGVFVLIIGDITYPDLRNKLYKRHLLDFISENNLENVLFLGFRENVYQYLAVSDICVFPFAQEEPFGIAVAESLALGIPSFFPFKGGAKEVQSIFQRGQELEIAAIASKIEQIRLNPTKFKQPFFIPAPLRFDNYHSKIISLMKSLNL